MSLLNFRRSTNGGQQSVRQKAGVHLMTRCGSEGARGRIVPCLLLLSMLAAVDASGQATGDISGTVTDSSGAAVPEAAVQVKNVGTGITRSVTSDGQGRYRAPELGLGNYDVSASKAGFSTGSR